MICIIHIFVLCEIIIYRVDAAYVIYVLYYQGRIENYQSPLDLDAVSTVDARLDGSGPDSKSKYLHEILAPGAEAGDQVLRVRRCRDQQQQQQAERGHSAYRAVQAGGDIPARGLARGCGGRGGGSSAEYSAETVNIHYSTVVRSAVRAELSGEEMDRMLEEKMVRVYADMERSKRERCELDTESRRHNDNFLASEKCLLTSNYRDVEPGAERGVAGAGMGMAGVQARALYDFVAETPAELGLVRGCSLTVTGRLDQHWLRGEAGGRRGIFPATYIELGPGSGAGAGAGRRARASHTFRAEQGGELSVVRGEVVTVERWVDPSWVEASLGDRRGLVPASYLALDTDPAPELPGVAEVAEESVTRPSQLIKLRLRREFAQRERRQQGLEQLLAALAALCPAPAPPSPSLSPASSSPRLTDSGRSSSSAGSVAAEGAQLTAQ